MQIIDIYPFLKDLFDYYIDTPTNIDDSNSNFSIDNVSDEMENRIEQFYKKDAVRHKYSSIYRFVLDVFYSNNSCKFDEFITVLNEIYERNRLLPPVRNKLAKLIDHLELEHLKLSNLTKIEEQSEYYYNLKNQVDELKDSEERIKYELDENFKEAKIELNTIKIDFLGILSSVLSLFTIFGLNSSIIPVLISQSTVTLKEKVFIFIGANIILVISIFSTLFFIKKIFYEYKGKTIKKY